MRNIFLTLIVLLFLAVGIFVFNKNGFGNEKVLGYGAPPYVEEDDWDKMRLPGFERFPDFLNWKRPYGPLRVGLQVGHWKNNELPDELEKIRGNSGARSSGISEWEVNLAIAQAVKKYLEGAGVVVDILPATVPPSYWADAFVAIHADGSTDPQTSGFKVAGPWRDYTKKATELVKIIEEEYVKEVGFSKDPNITRNMRGYYAFSWWRYEHAVHPMTPSVILETGFLTNPNEAYVLINNPEVPAKAISDALLRFLK